MNSLKIRNNLSLLDIELRTKIIDMGIKKAVEITGLKQPDISAWISGKRKWSYEKLLIVSDKLFNKKFKKI